MESTVYVNDNAMLIIRQLFAEMAHMIHDPHNNELVEWCRTSLIDCPEDNCIFITMLLQNLDREFNR